jgi:hypothetical protein
VDALDRATLALGADIGAVAHGRYVALAAHVRRVLDAVKWGGCAP